MFTHLQVRSGFSLMHSTVKMDTLIQTAKKYNQSSIALTDENVMHGVIPFYEACLANGIKPLLGMTTTIVHIDGRKDAVILIAKNKTGYKQLLQLSTTVQMDETDGELAFSQISECTELYVIVHFEKSSLYYVLTHTPKNETEASQLMERYQTAFGKDFYVGITEPKELETHQGKIYLKDFFAQNDVSACGLSDVRYPEEEDYASFCCLESMREDKVWEGSEAELNLKKQHILTNEEATLHFSIWPELIEATQEIAAGCDIKLDLHDEMLPRYPLEDDVQAADYLYELAYTNAEQRYGELTVQIRERLEHELRVIQSMGFSDYFLIVWDFIAFAKSAGIVVGPGRGSAAGSLVSYVLGITNVDPLKYHLLFERFLNPERISLPDIDIDFEDRRRDEVIAYVHEKYGSEYVAQIVTFGTFLARSIVRELIKALAVSEADAKYLLSEMTKQGQKPIARYVHDSEELKAYVLKSEKLKTLFRFATKLSGLPRHISTHAAGVIISKEPLLEDVPLIKGGQEIALTQYAMNDLETLGLLKIDFLGLRNLTFLNNVLKSIYYHTKQELDIEAVPLDDQKTYEMLQKGWTNRIFQLESRGMKRVLVDLRPTNFNDIVAVNALFRPGPMDYIPTYINRKNGEESISYPHPDLEPILAETYGVLVYQEQIMQIAHTIAGYSLGEADLLRRAVSDKDATAFEEQEEKFTAGCIQNGYSEDIAKEIFTWIVKFSNYGFNKSHAVAYSLVAYELAYLKANYSSHFFAEMFNSITSQQDTLKTFVQEAKNFGLEINPPSINESFGFYTVYKGRIQMGLQAIKGLNKNMVEAIVKERKQNGYYKSIFDFCLRVDLKTVSKETIESLIMVGAFDVFSSNRASHLQALETALEQGDLFKEFLGESYDFSGQLKTKLPETTDFSSIARLQMEQDLLGIYVSNHPVETYRNRLENSGYLAFKDLRSHIGNKEQKSACIIQEVKEIHTKKGESMAFLTLDDETTQCEAVVFPEAYRSLKPTIEVEKLVMISGKISERRGELQWIIHDMIDFNEELLNVLPQKLFIKFSEGLDEQAALEFIKQLSTAHKDNPSVIIYNEVTKKTYQLQSTYNMNPTAHCLAELRNYFGAKAVVLQ